MTNDFLKKSKIKGTSRPEGHAEKPASGSEGGSTNYT